MRSVNCGEMKSKIEESKKVKSDDVHKKKANKMKLKMKNIE